MTDLPRDANLQRPSSEGLLTSTSSAGENTRVWRVVAGALYVASATGLLLARQAGIPSYDTLWAEDGSEFLQDALTAPIASIGEPFAGYIHFVPRLMGMMAAQLPIEGAAMVFAVGAAAAIALMSLYIFFASESVIGSPFLRAALAGAVILLPAGGYEVSNNAANLHWYFTFGCFWALLDRSTKRGRLVAGSVMVLAATLCSPLSGIFFPIAVWQFLKRRSISGRWILIVYLVGLSVQGLVVITGVIVGDDVLGASDTNDWYEIPRLYGLAVPGALFTLERFLVPAWKTFGWGIAYVALALSALAALLVDLHQSRKHGRAPMGLIMFAMSLASFVITVSVRGSNALDAVGDTIKLQGTRYVIVPMLFVVSLLVLFIDRWTSSSSTKIGKVLFACGLIVLFALNFRVTNHRSTGPSWTASVRHAHQTCTSGGDRVRVAQSPHAPTIGFWYVEMACEVLQK